MSEAVDSNDCGYDQKLLGIIQAFVETRLPYSAHRRLSAQVAEVYDKIDHNSGIKLNQGGIVEWLKRSLLVLAGSCQAPHRGRDVEKHGVDRVQALAGPSGDVDVTTTQSDFPSSVGEAQEGQPWLIHLHHSWGGPCSSVLTCIGRKMGLVKHAALRQSRRRSLGYPSRCTWAVDTDWKKKRTKICRQ